jgi:hypothetical protein
LVCNETGPTELYSSVSPLEKVNKPCMNGLPEWFTYLYTHEDVLEKKILLEIGTKINFLKNLRRQQPCERFRVYREASTD